MASSKNVLDDTMGALVRMKPKPHEEMKVGKKAKKIRLTPNPALARVDAPLTATTLCVSIGGADGEES
jgi:hypothetical protein